MLVGTDAFAVSATIFKHHESVVFSMSRAGGLRWQRSSWTCPHREVAKSTAITAKNVAHSVVKGTRRAAHTVVYTFTP